MKKICGCCGQTFGCTPGHHCWCENVALTKKQLQWLKEHFDDCLCPPCLEIMSQVVQGSN